MTPASPAPPPAAPPAFPAADEAVARAFHEAYEQLAPGFGYKTREASAKPWADVPEQNRALMIATVGQLLRQGTITAAPPAGGHAQAAPLGDDLMYEVPGQVLQRMTADIDALAAECERLRAALTRIAAHDDPYSGAGSLVIIAEDALEARDGA